MAAPSGDDRRERFANVVHACPAFSLVAHRVDESCSRPADALLHDALRQAVDWMRVVPAVMPSPAPGPDAVDRLDHPWLEDEQVPEHDEPATRMVWSSPYVTATAIDAYVRQMPLLRRLDTPATVNVPLPTCERLRQRGIDVRRPLIGSVSRWASAVEPDPQEVSRHLRGRGRRCGGLPGERGPCLRSTRMAFVTCTRRSTTSGPACRCVASARCGVGTRWSRSHSIDFGHIPADRHHVRAAARERLARFGSRSRRDKAMCVNDAVPDHSPLGASLTHKRHLPGFTVRYEWDEKKNLANQKKHDGLSFERAREFLRRGDYVDIFDDEHSASEDRWIAVGPIQEGLILVVYTERSEDVIRIISARFADHDEQQLYWESRG